jgi:hypothetical protein
VITFAWIRWQRACLADDLHRLWRRCWYGKPGRHGGWQDYTTGQLAAIEADLAQRPCYALQPAPARLSLSGSPNPAPGPELFHHELERVADDSFVAGIADALLRATSPHVYAPHQDYWTYAWQAFDEDFAETRAWDDAEADALRRQCGLPDRHPLIPIAA